MSFHIVYKKTKAPSFKFKKTFQIGCNLRRDVIDEVGHNYVPKAYVQS